MKTKVLIIVFAKAMLSFGNVSHAQEMKPLSAENKTVFVHNPQNGNAVASDSNAVITPVEPSSYEIPAGDSKDLQNRMTQQLKLFLENVKPDECICSIKEKDYQADPDQIFPVLVY